ncbi:hypothetical protein EYF80_011803 [Liparis tanakae]|uniref:Uncharacterized protein n=1 Tax=Liparis tanakae TaxID=230148 RepID=A0A4Z2IJ93_9TELE|nr:hypothetical protein EYF80_011803 [Liparis tanakae]
MSSAPQFIPGKSHQSFLGLADEGEYKQASSPGQVEKLNPKTHLTVNKRVDALLFSLRSDPAILKLLCSTCLVPKEKKPEK